MDWTVQIWLERVGLCKTTIVMIIMLVSQRSYDCWHHFIPHHSQVGRSGTTMRLTRKTQRMMEKTSCSTVSHPAHHAIPRSIPRLRNCIRMWVLTDSGPPATLIMHSSCGLWQLLKTEVPFSTHGKFGENGILGESWKVWGKWHFRWVMESLEKMVFSCESWKVCKKWRFGWVFKSLGKMAL